MDAQKGGDGALDIYELALQSGSTTTTNTNTVDHRQQQQPNELVWDPDANKWPCGTCTYLNYPRSLKCTQCGTRRYATPVSQQQGPVSSSSSSNANTTAGSGGKSRSPSKTPSGQPSPTPPTQPVPVDNKTSSSNNTPPPSSSPVTSNSTPILDSYIIAKKLQKWTCAACTYENWPKSSRCVMCYTCKDNPGTGTPPPTTARSGASATSGGSRVNSVVRSPPNESVAGVSSDGGKDKNKRSLSSGKESGRKSPKNSSSNESVNSDPSSIGGGYGAIASYSSATSAATSSSIAASHPSGMLIMTSSSSSYNTSNNIIDQQQQQAANETILEKTIRRLKKQLRDVDYLWLTALKSLAIGDLADCCDPVEAYLAAGGDSARCLTNGEVHILNRSIPAANFEVGQTLFHLAIRYRREDLLTLLLACTDRPINEGRQVQRVPCHMSPESAADIRRQIHMSLRQRKGEMAAYFFTELVTFSLPSAIYDLPPSIQAKLFDALLDRSVQKKLEEEYPIINWSVEVTDRLGSRLFALWNRMCGDCLLDSVLQATWGVFDSENSLRQALADSLADAAELFYPRWKEYETYLASLMHYTIEEEQFVRDWDMILQLASRPGAALEQAHIFVLAHIIRRPIIVYGVRVVKSYFSGESIDYARFEGVYLPLLWESSFCWRSPICLSYTPGHFTALVPMEPDACEIGAIAHVREFPPQPRFVYLPLKDSDGQPLPIHFLNANERGHEQALLRAWLDLCVTEGGLWCCKMRIHRLSPSVQQMVDDWLDYYRRLAHLHQAASSALTRYNDCAAGGQFIHASAPAKSTNNNKSPHKAMSPPPTSISSTAGDAVIEEVNSAVVEPADGKPEKHQQQQQECYHITTVVQENRRICSPTRLNNATNRISSSAAAEQTADVGDDDDNGDNHESATANLGMQSINQDDNNDNDDYDDDDERS